jgi:hypothetical protein
VATVVGLRAVRLRETVKVFRFGHCWPDRKETGPRLCGQAGERPGPVGSHMRRRATATGNAAARNSFLRLFEIDRIADEPAEVPSRYKIAANAHYKFGDLLEGAGG